MALRKYIPTAPIGNCKGCGKRFNQVLSRGKARAYCSSACKPGRPPIAKQCDVAGCEALARSNGAMYCEKHYCRLRRTGTLDALRPPIYYLHCQHCGSPSNGSKACSGRCYTRLSRGTEAFRNRVACGEVFMPVQNKMACSDECDRIRKQDLSDARRCLSSMTHEGRSIRHMVFTRDNWTCRICGTPVNRNAKWPEPDYPTLDHIHPVSKGGSHEASNLQCAHAQCNIRKHAKIA